MEAVCSPKGVNFERSDVYVASCSHIVLVSTVDISCFNKRYLSPPCERFVQGWSITIILNGILRHGYNKLPCMCLFILNGLQMLKNWHNKIAKEITLNCYCNCAQKASCPQLCLILNLCPACCKVMSDNVNKYNSRMAKLCLNIHRDFIHAVPVCSLGFSRMQ